MLVKGRCDPLWQKASRAPKTPLSFQLFLPSVALHEGSPSGKKKFENNVIKNPIRLTLF